MNDRLLKRFTEQHGNDLVREDSADDQPEDWGAFGWLRGHRERATMLEIRRKDGSIMALGYPWLERAEFDPSQGITLQFTGQTVRLVGRNLNLLFDGVVRHRVPWLQEADRPMAMMAAKDAAVIERVDFG
jgi:hypothetical protein